MHDRSDRPLQVGDRVVFVGTISELSAGEDYCNVSVESLYGRRPDGQKERVSAINTGTLIRFNDEDPPLVV